MELLLSEYGVVGERNEKGMRVDAFSFLSSHKGQLIIGSPTLSLTSKDSATYISSKRENRFVYTDVNISPKYTKLFVLTQGPAHYRIPHIVPHL